MELKYEVTIELIGAHKPVIGAEIESLIGRAVDTAVNDHLDPDDSDVTVEEA